MAIESRGNILEKALEKEGNRRHGPVHTCVSMSMWSLEAGFPLSRRGVCTPSLLILNALLGPEGQWGRGGAAHDAETPTWSIREPTCQQTGCTHMPPSPLRVWGGGTKCPARQQT